MATVNFLLRSSKNVAPLTLRLLFRDNNKPSKVFDKEKNEYLELPYTDFVYSTKTKYRIDKPYWKKHNSNSKDAETKNKQVEVKADLLKIENFILDAFNQTNEANIDKDWLDTQMDLFYNPVTENQKSDLLTDAIQSIIDEAPTRKNAKGGIGISLSRVNSYKSLKNMITEYQGNKALKVKDVNKGFAKDFLKHLLNTKQYQKSYALKKIADLKTVCNDADIYGIETNPQYKKIDSTKPQNDNILYLTPDELKKIAETNLLNEAHQNARKWLLLGCNLGQRGGDLLKLNETNFINRNGLEVIELKQQKTGKNVTIPVLETTKEIIKTGLPYKISIQKFNEHIKEVCRLSEINELVNGGLITVTKKGEGNKKKRKIDGVYEKWELISSHVCRRSFATNLYGILPTTLIMQITAHSSEKMLLNYIGKDSLDFAQQIADFYTLQALKDKKETTLTVIKTASNQN